MSDRLRRHYRNSLLGRLRLKLFDEIDGGKDIPQPGNIRLHLARRYREQPDFAELEQEIIQQDSCWLLRESELPKKPRWADVLDALEDHPLPTTFVELRGCRGPWPDPFGVLIQRAAISPSGFVYPLTAILETGFPKALGARIEIRACREARQPELSVLSAKGWTRGSLADLPPKSALSILVRVLAAIVSRHTADEVTVSLRPHPLAPEGPEDAELGKRMLMASVGDLFCTRARVDLSDVKPFSLDFCLSHPLDLVEQEAGRLKRHPGTGGELLVYWDGHAFITPDDYIEFLAYRTLRLPTVPVVILGEFPAERARVIAKGGLDLMPPAGAMHLPDWESEESKQILLDSRLRHHLDAPSDAVATLYGIHIVLSRLIASSSTTERDLHTLLAAHPIALAPHGIRMLSEVALGRKYRIDLVIQSDSGAQRLQLIELEGASKRVFTRLGRPRAELTHATQQVEDWLRWWREHREEVPAGLDGSIDPDGIVVIGRDREMTTDDRNRLASLNSGRRVQIVTYDDLLRRLEAMLEHLEKATGDGRQTSERSRPRAR